MALRRSQRPRACWDCGFDSLWGRASLSLSCECCVSSGSGLCDGLITRPAKSPSVVCLMTVMVMPRKLGGSGPLHAAGPKGGRGIFIPPSAQTV